MLKRVAFATVTLLLVTLAVARVALRDGGLAGRYPDGLRIGYAVEAPYAFVDDTGRVTGESPELARHVAGRLGLAVTFVQADFGVLLDQLEEGRYDVVAAGLFITPERARRVRFSVPTFQAVGAALVRRGNPKGLHSLEDITAAGATVVVLAASVEEALAARAGISQEHTIVVPDAAAARRALEAGRADLLMLSGPTVHWMATRDSAGVFEEADLDVGLARSGTVDLGGFAFRKDEDILVEAWNRELAGLIGTPEHLALIEPFGFTARFLPPPTGAAPMRTTP